MWKISPRHRVARPLPAFAVVAALAACSSGGSATSGSSVGTTTPASATASGAVMDPNAGLKSGSQLKALLPGVKDLPAGFTVTPDGVRDTGDVFGPPTSPTAAAHPDCTTLDGNGWTSSAGYPASFAQTEFHDSYGDMVFVEADSYRGSDARAIMAGYAQLFVACKKYKTKYSGMTATVSVVTKPGPKVGDGSVRAVETSPLFKGSTTLVAIRVGTAIVAVTYSSTSKDLGAKAVSLATTLAQKL